MATTADPTYPDTLPELTNEHLVTVKEWLASAMGDEDKSTDPEDNSYYAGEAHALRSVLNLLYGLETDPDA